jgi:hypothetical protein
VVSDGAVQPNFGGAFEVGAKLTNSSGGLPPGRRGGVAAFAVGDEAEQLGHRCCAASARPRSPKREGTGASWIRVDPTCFEWFSRAEPGQYRPAKRPVRGFACIVFGPG